VFWLRERHGSIRAVATLLQIPEATIRGYVYNTKRKRVPPETAKRIVSLVLAHRKPTGPLDLWEEEPGLRPIILIDRLHLDGYQYLHSTRADLLRRLGRRDEARAEYERALELARAEPERRFLRRRLAEVSD